MAQVLQHVSFKAAQVANATADDRTFVEAERKAYFDARMIGFGVAVGAAILLWIPYLIYKAIVRLCSLCTSMNGAETGNRAIAGLRTSSPRSPPTTPTEERR